VRATRASRYLLGGDYALFGPFPAETVVALGQLPEQVVIEQTRCCHASPVSDLRSFMPAPGDDESKLLAGLTEARVIFGHTGRSGAPTGFGARPSEGLRRGECLAAAADQSENGSSCARRTTRLAELCGELRRCGFARG
jgi:hypothetical protein